MVSARKNNTYNPLCREMKMADGRWPTADSRWPIADGRWPMLTSARKEWKKYFWVMSDWYSFEAHIYMTSGHFQKLQIHDGGTSNHTLLKVSLLKPYIFYASEKPEVMLVYSCSKLVKPSIPCIFGCPRGQVPQPWPWGTTIRPPDDQ